MLCWRLSCLGNDGKIMCSLNESDTSQWIETLQKIILSGIGPVDWNQFSDLFVNDARFGRQSVNGLYPFLWWYRYQSVLSWRVTLLPPSLHCYCCNRRLHVYGHLLFPPKSKYPTNLPSFFVRLFWRVHRVYRRFYYVYIIVSLSSIAATLAAVYISVPYSLSKRRAMYMAGMQALFICYCRLSRNNRVKPFLVV